MMKLKAEQDRKRALEKSREEMQRRIKFLNEYGV